MMKPIIKQPLPPREESDKQWGQKKATKMIWTVSFVWKCEVITNSHYIEGWCVNISFWLVLTEIGLFSAWTPANALKIYSALHCFAVLLMNSSLLLSLSSSLSCLRSKFNSHHGGRIRHAQWAGWPADTRRPDSWWGTVEDAYTHLCAPGSTCFCSGTHTNTDVIYCDIGKEDNMSHCVYSKVFPKSLRYVI